MYEEKRSGWCSWPAIILMLVFFWPVGVYFLIKRISGDTRAEMSAKIVCIKYIGIVLGMLAAIMLLALFGGAYEADEIGETLACILFLGAGGIFLWIYGDKIKRRANDTRRYLSIIVNGYARGIDEIAAAAGKTYEEVNSDIHSMIDKGYLKNAYIDEAARRIVLANDHTASGYETAENSVTHENAETHMVKCPNCGANNLVASENAECEYCGSPLE